MRIPKHNRSKRSKKEWMRKRMWGEREREIVKKIWSDVIFTCSASLVAVFRKLHRFNWCFTLHKKDCYPSYTEEIQNRIYQLPPWWLLDLPETASSCRSCMAPAIWCSAIAPSSSPPSLKNIYKVYLKSGSIKL